MGSEQEDPTQEVKDPQVCAVCKELRVPKTVYDELPYCEECEDFVPARPEVFGLAFLLATMPFQVGDKVECRTAGKLFDGVGVIKDIDMEFRQGGTPVYPAFQVEFEKKSADVPDTLWYTEHCLTKV